MNIKHLFRRKPKEKPLTVNSLLKEDDVGEVINKLIEHKSDTKTLICIAIEDNGESWRLYATPEVNNADIVWYFEMVKNDIFNDDKE